jgi:hypothetical protein
MPMKALKIFAYLILLWVPRIVCILFVALTSLIAMDVFGQGTGFWKTFLAFLLHLVPSFIMIIILILSWKWSWIGGILFTLLGIIYIIWYSQARGEPSSTIYIPLIMVGILFLASWLFRKQIKDAREVYNQEMGV